MRCFPVVSLIITQKEKKEHHFLKLKVILRTYTRGSGVAVRWIKLPFEHQLVPAAPLVIQLPVNGAVEEEAAEDAPGSVPTWEKAFQPPCYNLIHPHLLAPFGK